MDAIIIMLGVCLGLLLLGILVVKFISSVYMPFVEERDYIRMEIARSHGDARIHYKHELRRLYLAQIPFIGGRLAEANRKRAVKRKNENNPL